ncbi:hypothetical protein SLS53_008211 [Cytospora paraplurivora]|uniref:Uncharacterized protein n=1 Tax=Cytospora paraplurivora TaxID=2898453 RepID=A0AAN9U0V4_9PEZI
MTQQSSTITTLLILLSSLSLTTSSALNPRQSLTPPAACDVIPTWEVTSFSWHNTSDNLDCANESDVPYVCFNSTSSGLVACDGNLGACDECGVYGCSTGLPLQPAGYGPPDNVSISIPSVSGYGGCFESNPQLVHRDGDSNEAISTGHIDFAPISSWDCTNGSTITASGSVDFEITCSWDAGNNATCVIPANETVVIPVLSYTID